MKCTSFLFIACLAITYQTYSQGAGINPTNYTKIAEVIPPSPNAASLGKYGGLNTNLSSGMLNYALPIYEYNSVNIKVPISISYNSNGIKVDEIGGRIGMSWNLQVGGVITRTLFGKPDEIATRLRPPAQGLNSAPAYVAFMDAVVSEPDNGGDAQPDMFSFNFGGYSGRFILDSAGNVILLEHSNLKFEKSQVGATVLFKATAEDGVQYFFGGVNSTEKTVSWTSGGVCAKSMPNAVATAWYLQSIIHPDKDTVNFSYNLNTGVFYKVGNSETIYKPDVSGGPIMDVCLGGNGVGTVPHPDLVNTSCVIDLHAEIATLSEIKSTGGARIRFRYISRMDYSDSLLSSIEVYQPGKSTPFKTFSFSYETAVASSFGFGDATLRYRPFLIGYTEKSTDNQMIKQWVFSYNDINGLPSRLSYAQDDYGYFNGKSNTTLIPRPVGQDWINAFSIFYADRAPDTTYSFKGLLTKIVYPTGGQDTILYEANRVYSEGQTQPAPVQATVSATSSGPATTDATTFSIQTNQQVQLFASVELLPGNPDFPDNSANIRVTDAQTNAVLFDQLMIIGTNQSASTTLNLQAGHSYTIEISCLGAGVQGGGSLFYMPGTITTYYYNKIISGSARVAKVITKAEAASAPIIKRYFYSRTLEASAASSAFVAFTPIYQKKLTVLSYCPSLPCGVNQFPYYSMYSNTINNIYSYTSSPIAYETVWESFGNDFENGGIRHDFMIHEDGQAGDILGDHIIGAPMISFSWKSGKEITTSTFKNIAGAFVPVQKVITHYNDDQRIHQIIKGYTVNKKAQPSCDINQEPVEALLAYDVNAYDIYRTWLYPDTVITLTYSVNGVSYLTDTIVTQYANATHALPTSLQSTMSDRRHKVVKNYYPQDLSLAGNPESARQALITNHILSPILKQETLIGGTQVSAQITDYETFSTGGVQPRSHTMKTFNNASEKRVDFLKYNKHGKIIEQSKTDDKKHAYVWDYNSMYPVAEAENASSDRIAYTSFEADGLGNWSLYPGSTIFAASNAMTGKYVINGGVQKTVPAGNYIVGVWSVANTWVNGQSVDNNPKKIIGQWRYFEVVLNNVSEIWVRGDTIDEVRLIPAGAQMTTYTYDPLIGMTSQTDANNRITYYEYDSFGRLKHVRDENKNVLKTYDYQYQKNYNQ